MWGIITLANSTTMHSRAVGILWWCYLGSRQSSVLVSGQYSLLYSGSLGVKPGMAQHLYCTIMYCPVLVDELYCFQLQSTVPYYMLLYWVVLSCFTWTVFYSIVLFSIVLYCTLTGQYILYWARGPLENIQICWPPNVQIWPQEYSAPEPLIVADVQTDVCAFF